MNNVVLDAQIVHESGENIADAVVMHVVVARTYRGADLQQAGYQNAKRLVLDRSTPPLKPSMTNGKRSER